MKKEFEVLRQLKGFGGFAEAIYFGTRQINKSVLAMTLLGDDLETKFTLCNRRFSEKTILNIAVQMIERLDVLHNHTLAVHRDLKPENMAVGIRKHDKHIIYLIDFGLSREFFDPKTKNRIPYESHVKKSLIGTVR